MARTNGAKTEAASSKAAEIEELETTPEAFEAEDLEVEAAPEVPKAKTDTQEIEDCLGALKALLVAVEKLQKARQEVGDIKSLLVRMLDGELVSGDELEQIKTGVNGLTKLVRAYSDHQSALSKAQPARQLLDDVLKVQNK
ncbi:MAG TPA: hypothetical protein IGS53_04975 [Leptolyngbyaceae cyanobacterium M33_DOE_097]|uniref:Uncharacterized protein n=1 Tax=Oscillatoriales cyanobacterium SpSt-418 TaxID=2282169 RepID=A0A7C3PEW4_9CYAN|nr:hypothetical protein [Leptolyngbyaceae cyanobacterium M33_DOE_097]